MKRKKRTPQKQVSWLASKQAYWCCFSNSNLFTSCVSVTFKQFSQCFRLFRYHYCLCYGGQWPLMLPLQLFWDATHCALRQRTCLTYVMCVLTAPLMGIPHSSPSSPRHNNTENRLINNPTMLSKHSNERKSGPSLSHNILINQSPDERHEEVVEKKSDVSRGWFMKFKERHHFCNMKVQDEAVGAWCCRSCNKLSRRCSWDHEWRWPH